MPATDSYDCWEGCGWMIEPRARRPAEKLNIYIESDGKGFQWIETSIETLFFVKVHQRLIFARLELLT